MAFESLLLAYFTRCTVKADEIIKETAAEVRTFARDFEPPMRWVAVGHFVVFRLSGHSIYTHGRVKARYIYRFFQTCQRMLGTSTTLRFLTPARMCAWPCVCICIIQSSACTFASTPLLILEGILHGSLNINVVDGSNTLMVLLAGVKIHASGY